MSKLPGPMFEKMLKACEHLEQEGQEAFSEGADWVFEIIKEMIFDPENDLGRIRKELEDE